MRPESAATLHYLYTIYTCVIHVSSVLGPYIRPSQKVTAITTDLCPGRPRSRCRSRCVSRNQHCLGHVLGASKLSGSSSSRCLPFFGKLAKVPLPDGRDWRHVHLLIGSHKDKGCKIGRVDARVDVRVRGAPTDHERRRCTGSSSLTVRMFERSNSHASYR